MAFMRNINDFILTLVALSLPSIAAIDCNGKPFHCLNSTHFLICVDFGSGVSSTMDDFIIPCPPSTVCQATNRFECEFPTVTTTIVTPVVTNSPLGAMFNNDVVIDTVSDVTTVPFEEYFNTISTTTLSEGNLITGDAVTTELPVNNPSERFNVPATDSIINETAINVGVDQTTVTELIPNVAKNVSIIFEQNSNISETLSNATEMVPTDIDLINLSENVGETVGVTENYESNSTLLETIIGATNFRQFNTPLYNSTSSNVTEPILSEATESIIRLPIDDKQVYLTTLDASPDVVLDNSTIENVTESIPTKPTEYKELIKHQSNSTLNETMSTGDIVQNDPTTLNTALDINRFDLNVNHSGLSFNEITTKYEEQISTADPTSFEVKEHTVNIPVDEKVYLPTFDVSPNVFLDNQTIDNSTESMPAETTEYNHLIESRSDRFNNKSLNNSTSYDITEPILSDVTESIISISVDYQHPYMTTLDASPDVFLDVQTKDTTTESIPAETTEYKHLIDSESNSTLYETSSDGDIIQNNTTKLNTILNTYESALNEKNSDSYLNEITTKYKEQISTAEPAKENELEDKQAFLTTLDESPDVFLDNKTIDTATESMHTETTEYIYSKESQSNSTLNATLPSGDIEQNYTTTANTILNTNGSGSNVRNFYLSLNEDTKSYYEEQISTAQNNFELSGNTGTEITPLDVTEMANITKPKFSVTTIATTTVNTEPKTNIFDDMQTTELSFKDTNNYLNSTEDSVTSALDNRSVKPEKNTNTTQSENLTNVDNVENVTKTEIHLLLPKPPMSNEATTIVHGNHSSVDNTSTTYIIPNIDTITAQNKTTLDDISVRTDEAQKVFTSENNVNDKTADSPENNYFLKPVTEPTSTPLSNNAHNVLESDLTNQNLQEMSTSIKIIELTARGNVTNETLRQNVIGSDMINSTEITVTPSNHIKLSNRVSVSTTDDQINTVEISESTPNDILENATQEVDFFSYSNLYYQTDIEEVSHDQGVPRNNILSGDAIESTSSIFVLTTESTKEPYFEAALQATTSFNSVSDQMYTAESDNYLTSTTNSPQPEATASTTTHSRNSSVDTSKLVTRENEVEEISTASSKLEITSAMNVNSNVAVARKQNIPITDNTNSSHQTAITSSTAFVNTNSAVNQVEQVTRRVEDEKISIEPSPISFTINKTAYVATEQNVSSTEVTPEPGDLISDRFKYTTTTETANDSVHQESHITIASDSSTAKPSVSSALSNQSNREIKESLLATTTSNTATDLSAISNLTVPNFSDAGVTNLREEINAITAVDSLTTETTIDAISKASTDNVLEKYPITINKADINAENIRNPIKTNITTEDNTVTEDTKNTEPLRIQRENLSKLEIASVVTDRTIFASFIADDVNYTENENKLSDTQDRKLNVQPNIPEILPERFGANVYDTNSSVNNATFIDGLTSMNTAVAADTKLTKDETNQKVTSKMSTTETMLKETLKEKDVMEVMPKQKTYSESIEKTPKSNGAINTNLMITTEVTTSSKSHTERKLSFTTSIQESKYQSNLASSTESWRAPIVTEPVFDPTRPYTETLVTSSKPYTESNDYMSQDVTNLTPKLNLAYPSEKHYINPPQNIEPATKNVLTSLEPSVIFSQVTEPSGVPNQDVESSSVRKSTTQESYGIDTLKLVQKQGVSSTENNFINVTPLASSSAITKPVDLSTRQSFTAPNTQTLAEQHVFKNGEQIEVPTTEKLQVNVISPSVTDDKPFVDVTAVPILKSSNNISKDVMPNDKTHAITAMYNSNRTVESVSNTEFNKVEFNITSTTEKTMTQSSDLDIVMVDIVNTTDLLNLGEIATGSNNPHSGISAIKATSQQVEKYKAVKSVAKDVHETEKEEKPETEKEEKPNVAETNPGKIEDLTSTESIPINKQANVQYNPPLNIEQKPVQNATRIRPDSHVENTTPRYNTKTKLSVANTHNSKHPDSVTSKHNFVCKSNNRGRFSDNNDCRKFYICIGKHEPIKGICPNNTVFSELRKQCTKNLSHCVRNNQFQCVSEGRFSDYLNDNIYYICVNNKANRFIRFKLQCQNGYHLDKTSVRCVMNTESILSTSQQSQQSASEVSTSNQSISAKSEKIQEKPKSSQKFECKRSGKFPEPNDCRKYYVCTKLGKSEYRQRSKKCDSDELYNRDKKKCVDADSYQCS